MVLKIIAFGLVFEKDSYLRDNWNVMDCFIVLSSWFSMFYEGGNLGVLRTIRVMKVLRTLSSFPEMQKLVTVIFKIIPSMLNILFMFIIAVMVFACIAM